MSDDQYKTDIVKRLRGYCELVRKINILQFQLANPPKISEEEMMSAMAYAHGTGGTQAPGHISDKTAYIALHYREKAAAINEESVSIISSRLTRMEREKNELDFYISILELRHREVIEKIYMQGKSKERVASELGLTSRTVQNLRRKAVEDLAEMCRFAAEGE